MMLPEPTADTWCSVHRFYSCVYPRNLEGGAQLVAGTRLVITDSSTPFGGYWDLAGSVEGWFSELAVAMSDIFLTFQSLKSVNGDFLEIGAWHGRSAILWLMHARKNEKTFVVDLEARGPLAMNLERVSNAVDREFVLMKGSSFRIPDSGFQIEYRRKMRLVHIDGDHTAPGVYNDIQIGHGLLHMNGVMIVDDFMNPRFPQITEVVIEYLNQFSHDLSMIACGANKAFIVRTKFYEFWASHFEINLERELGARIEDAAIYFGTAQNKKCFGIR